MRWSCRAGAGIYTLSPGTATPGSTCRGRDPRPVAQVLRQAVVDLVELRPSFGADVMTGPLSAILALLKHPLTDIGLAQFLADHKKAAEAVKA